MKDWFKKSLFLPTLFVSVILMIATSFIQVNISYGQAVPLIPIQTGNATLDKGLPIFYDCIDEKIDNSKGVEADNYFEKEPTKNEVTTCYNEVFFDNSDVQSSNDNSDVQSSNDNSDVQSSNDNSDVQSSNDNSDVQSSNDNSDVQSSNDNSDVQSSESIEDNDIERFSMLFGNIE